MNTTITILNAGLQKYGLDKENLFEEKVIKQKSDFELWLEKWNIVPDNATEEDELRAFFNRK